MTNHRSALTLISTFTIAMAMPSYSLVAQPSSSQESEAANPRLTVAKGQYLSIIMPEEKEDGDAARQVYYRQAFPLGQKFGLKRETQLKMDSIEFSNYKPTGLVFFSYPDQESEKQLTSQPEWPAIKAQRPEAWNELRIYSAAMREDLNLSFDPAKYYSLVVAWTNPDKPEDYQRYLSGIEKAVHSAGGRFIYKMKNPKMEAHATSLNAPSQLTFVEWDAPNGFAKVQKTEDYKASAPYFRSGVTKVEFYYMSVNGKS
ncbi:hypothetical protein GCM10009096_15580 [Parasphingorhabdus litoris]|uniref:DUF1330 domain-containing protein n=1 Tax=Parasphingorhabdus litoris TaxID=394733 RepID=A0ABN1AEZ0_9SPHN|nr:hypothetical protein [Parasphingorhabdus litoris]